MIDALLTTLLSVLDAHRDRLTGNAQARDVQQAKKRFALALNGIIDYRVKLAFEERRKHQSQQMLAVADSINSTVKSTASTIKSISALNSAPPPPRPEDLNNKEAMKKWREIYEQWYETKRKAGVSIE
jgi:hypothetical protein